MSRAKRGLSDGFNGGLADRGVYRIPWLSPNGEAMLVAVDHTHREVGEWVLIPWNDDETALNAAIDAETEALWERLDAEDPMHNLELFQRGTGPGP